MDCVNFRAEDFGRNERIARYDPLRGGFLQELG